MSTTTDNPNDIRITRIYDAPLALVWEAWTDVEQVAQWWGPRGFTITTHSKDFRAGGTWVYTMHGPDGIDWPNFTRYHEVVPQARLVYDHGASAEGAAPMFQVTATFRDLGGKTELVMIMTLPTADAAKQTRVHIKAAGGNATWDRLAEYLAQRVSAQEVFVIARTFDAPITTVFDMWTSPDHFSAWLPPAGFSMSVLRGEISEGSATLIAMTNGDIVMHVRQSYRQLQRPALLEYAQTFTDIDGNDARQPGAPAWPVTTLVTVQFVEETPTRTRVAVRFTIDGTVTAAEVDAFVAERAGMTTGWNASFDVLDEVLTRVTNASSMPR